MDGILVLSDGRVFPGQLRGAMRPAAGEVIFNTAMTGYQEILTDPSYKGQIVTMTYPHIGNYGANGEDIESRRPFAAGLIVKELSLEPSNWRATDSLNDYLARHGLTVLEGIDTRALVIALRERGAMPGLVAPAEEADLEALRREAASLPGMEGMNLAAEVSVERSYAWKTVEPVPREAPPPRFRVIAYDFGLKFNIARMLARRGVALEIVPWTFPPEEALARKPDGIFLSNGPGDPEPVREGVATVRALLGRVPIFGICLGHQILSLALGARTYKLKFGHHGANHPVQDLATGKIEITSHNHGFAVDGDCLPADVRVTHRSLNDGTVEGIASLAHPAFSVQYHPEASPGPHDAAYLFDRFIEMLVARRRGAG